MGVDIDFLAIAIEIAKIRSENEKANAEAKKTTAVNSEVSESYKNLEAKISSLIPETKKLQEAKKEEVNKSALLVNSLEKEKELRTSASKNLSNLRKTYMI